MGKELTDKELQAYYSHLKNDDEFTDILHLQKSGISIPCKIIHKFNRWDIVVQTQIPLIHSIFGKRDYKGEINLCTSYTTNNLRLKDY